MDQLKIGEFIARTRKEKGFTQRQLADALLISDKTVSKWECGNGMPEVSLMMPLCETLGITVNELLSAKRLSTSDYQKNAEVNLMKLIKEKQEAKFRMIIEVLVLFITLLSGCSLVWITGLVDLEKSVRIALIVIAVIIFVAGIGVCAALEMRNAQFKCPKCGERFYPSKAAYIMGMHTITRRHLKCPKCGKRSWCIRCAISKDNEEE